MKKPVHNFIKGHIIPWLIHKYHGKEFFITSTLIQPDYIHGANFIESFTLKNGCVFKASEQSATTVNDVLTEYNWQNLQATDTVLDIGANCGGFAICAARKCKQVIAVEPIFSDELRDNISRNNIQNIMVIEAVFGDPSVNKTQDITYHSHTKYNAPVVSFKELMDIAGGHIDFLKCDCEGAEQYIPHELLLPVRTIEIELHNLGNPKIQALYDFICKYWDFEIGKDEYDGAYAALRVLHAHKKRDKEDMTGKQ